VQRWSPDTVFDLTVTLACWCYFTLGFLLLFAPRYLLSGLFSSNKEAAFQRYNRRFYQVFFHLLQTIAPQQQWKIDSRIATLRGSVIVCNHRSYLDPLLLIAHLDRAITVVKSVFFTLPIFGRVIRTAGYLPSTSSGPFAHLLLSRMETMPAYLAAGGNLFVFPEGTRSRDGRIKPLHPGALKIARQFHVPLHVLVVTNTERLFTPGVFRFAASRKNVIQLQLVETIPVEEMQSSLADLGKRIRQAMEDGVAHSVLDVATPSPTPPFSSKSIR
jgi:1-acyl-sn-glycerol-3-phosphate acyltransferase